MDGKALAAKILAELKAESVASKKRKPSLGMVLVGGNEATRAFIAQKKKTAEELGVDFRIYEYEPTISTNDLRKHIATVVHDADPDGLIIQLPLPAHINTQYILNAVPSEKDVDVLSARAVGNFAVGKSKILPPIVGAVQALFQEYGIDYHPKHVVVVGAGRLVGKPMAAWLASEKVSFTVVDENTADIGEFTKNADIIITGVGKPGLIIGDMIKDGAVVIDAGTSVSNQQPATSNQQEAGSRKPVAALAGDVDFDSVSQKASFITPVPGGVGPLTVVVIYKNLFTLARQ